LACREIGENLQYCECLCTEQTTTRLEILMSIAEILDIDVKELVISNKKDTE